MAELLGGIIQLTLADLEQFALLPDRHQSGWRAAPVGCPSGV